MERAIFITKLSQLKYANNNYTRLYYGNEFCERLTPSPSQLSEALSFVLRNKLNFSFVTPYVTNSGLKKLGALFKLLEGSGVNCEVIINDWGTLNLINRRHPSLLPVLGRLLTKQKRGPRVIKLLKRQTKPRLLKDPDNPRQSTLLLPQKLPLALDPYYLGSNASSVPIIHNFLINQRIRRIELDNTGQGLILELPRNRLSASIYLPYVYISTTFFCPTAGCDQEKERLIKIKPCQKQCRRYLFKLRHKTMPKVIYLGGNTQFYKNTKSRIKQWESMGIDRIVYAPEVPI
ncbi:hypothetical protein ACFL1I_07530 [Candidatus Omnitrophota bacterium]